MISANSAKIRQTNDILISQRNDRQVGKHDIYNYCTDTRVVSRKKIFKTTF